MIEMATGLPPWAELGHHSAVAAMYAIACTTQLPPFPETMSALGRDFLSRCFERDPAKRPSATQLLMHGEDVQRARCAARRERRAGSVRGRDPARSGASPPCGRA